MRRGSPSPLQLPPLTPATKKLMFVLGGIFLAQVLVRIVLGFSTPRYAEVFEWNLGLSASGLLEHGKVWTLLTWFWCAPLNSVFGILFTLLMLWFFGPALEMRVGAARLVAAFVFAGFFSGVVGIGAAAIAGPSSSLWALPMVGTHGAVAGLLAFLFWLERESYFNVFVAEVKGLHLLLFFAAMHLLQGALTHPLLAAVPIGGMLAGMLSGSQRDPWRLWESYKLSRIRRRVRLISGGKDDRDFLN